MKFLPRPRFISVSPWLLAAATGLLVLIVVTFALSNMRREKRLMTNALIQKAATLIQVVHSGTRASYVSDLRRGMWNSDPWSDHVQRVIDHVTEDPDVHYIAVIDEQRTILAHSQKKFIGLKSDFALPETKQEGKNTRPQLEYHVRASKTEGKSFIAVRPFFTYRPIVPPQHMRSLQELSKKFPAGKGLLFPPHHFNRNNGGGNENGRHYIAISLDMDAYESTLAQLRFQVIALSVTMLLVGIGGWLSLVAVQGYRVSQRTLSEIQAFTGLLVARLPVGIIATDKEGAIATWNQAAVEMLGVPLQRAMGKRPTDILPQPLAAFLSSDTLSQEDPLQEKGRKGEVTLTLNGINCVLICQQIAIRDSENRYVGQVLLLSNITKLKNLEKGMREHERLAAVGRMAAGVAHEVRNPLSSVKGLALLLKDKLAPQTREKEAAELLIKEVERMNRTISELLSFARPAPLSLNRVDLRTLLARNIELIKADAASDGIVTVLQIADDLLPVAADQDRLNQVFINILLNAVQAMENGGRLLIRAENHTPDMVEVSFTDTGCGMDQRTLEQIFYPYFTTKTGGTGIGLAISQKIVSDHGGNIGVESELGKGTTVRVTIPVYGAKES